MGRHKPQRKGRSPYVDELRDKRTNISTENHFELFYRLDKALRQGIHNAPGERKKRG